MLCASNKKASKKGSTASQTLTVHHSLTLFQFSLEHFLILDVTSIDNHANDIEIRYIRQFLIGSHL